MIPRCFLILAIAFLMVGCNRWDSKPGHYMQGTNAMAGVSAFIVTYGWDSSTNDEDLWHWEDLQPHYVHGLPWSKYKNQQFPALTHDGILYVLSNPGWHHDYGGVAYNPQTNRFPTLDGFGFKPIGGHWYVWCMPELLGGMYLPQIYEGDAPDAASKPN
jgi:hypothetical protein